MGKLARVLLAVTAVLYPFIVFLLLVVFKAPVRIISLALIAAGALFFVSATSGQKAPAAKKKANIRCFS